MALGETETQQQRNEKCWLLDKEGFSGAGVAEARAQVSLTKYRSLGALVSLLERNPPGKQAQALFLPQNKIGRIKGETELALETAEHGFVVFFRSTLPSSCLLSPPLASSFIFIFICR